MTATEFVESIGGFSKLSYSDQVKRFCWHLAMQRQKPRFTGADVASCFDDTGCPKPTSMSPFLVALAKAKPPFLIKKANGYELSRQAREQFDSVLGKRDATIAVDKLLQELPDKLTVTNEKVFLEEALTCFRHSAFRATIVMVWNLAYDHLCKVTLNDTQKLSDFNTHLAKSFPKAKPIKSQDDFESLKESDMIQVAKSAAIISNSVHKVMKEKLDRRNTAAHPSNIVISRLTTEDFIVDLVQNVVLKL